MRLALAVLLLSATLDVRADEATETALRFWRSYASGDAAGVLSRYAPDVLFECRIRRTFGVQCFTPLRTAIVATRDGNETTSVDVEADIAIHNDAPGAIDRIETKAATIELKRDGDRWVVIGFTPYEVATANAILAAAAEDRECLARAVPAALAGGVSRELSRVAIDLINHDQSPVALRLMPIAATLAEIGGDESALSDRLSVLSVLSRLSFQSDATDLGLDGVAYAERGGDPATLTRSLVRLGRADQRLETFLKAAALEPFVDDAVTLGILMTQLARQYSVEEREAQALTYAEKAVRYGEETGAPSVITSAQLNIAGAFGNQGDFENAAKMYQRIFELAERHGMGDLATFALAHRVRYLQLLHDEQYKTVLTEVEARPRDGLARYMAAICRWIEAFEAGDFVRAEQLHRQALVLALEEKDDMQVAACHFGIATCRLGLLEPVAALQSVADADAVLGKRGLLSHWISALAYRQLGCLREALAEIQVAIEFVEKDRRLSPGTRFALWNFATHADAYSMAVELLVSEGDVGEALRMADRAKARALLDQLVGAMVRLDDVLTPAERDERGRLQREVEAANRRPAAERVESAREALITYDALLASRHAEIRPEVEAIGYTRADLANLLPDRTSAIVEFAAGADVMHLFVVRRDAAHRVVVRHRALALAIKDVGPLVAELNAALDQRDLRYGAISRRLHDLLLEPAARELAGVKRLCIIPHRDLWSVPFHALRTKDGHYVADRLSMFYAPSIAALVHVRRQPSRPGTQVAAIANPKVSRGALERISAATRGLEFGALPDAEDEVRSIAALYGNDQTHLLLGRAATEGAVRSALAKSDVIHVATHAFANPSDGTYSALMLTPDAADAHDGLLEAREIAEMHLSARLAVLAACETGRGRIQNGEGVISLAWAFLAAGCPTTVVSQWKADSKATTKLMIEFHRRLVAGESKADALRHAALALRKKQVHAHPYYWAPFVVIGAD